MKTLIATTLAALALASSISPGRAAAQPLADPTRPPAAFTPAGAGMAAATTPQLPRLQSVLISRVEGGRHVAVIDGETVHLGERYKGARIARMTQTEVELVRGTKRQVLHLMPQPPGAPGSATVQRVN